MCGRIARRDIHATIDRLVIFRISLELAGPSTVSLDTKVLIDTFVQWLHLCDTKVLIDTFVQ
jgi:hypothetical protein